MKFYEKLIILRKKALLSQEQLAEKLDVTRQTISKWELVQTKPDMDKLNAMSKLFEVDINILTNDELSLEGNKHENKVEPKKKDNSNRKIILYIVIIIFVASLTTLLYRVGSDIIEVAKEKNAEIQKTKEDILKKQQETEDKIKKTQEEIEQKQKEQKEKSERDSFNRDFETWGGKQTDSGVEFQIDKIIKNNKKNSDHLVEVLFDGTSYGTDPNNIKTIKNSLKTWTSDRKIQYYEISIDYDSNGYVNKVTIETR